MMHRNQFIEALETFDADFRAVSGKEEVLKHKKDALQDTLRQALSVKFSKINQDNKLYQLSEQLKKSVLLSIDEWDQKLEAASPMKALSEQYQDRVIFLVFGKVNAGKSSFCNFLTSQFDSSQTKRFRFENGQVQYFDDVFAEGVIETTVAIQGVELGHNLVLLDSPGLHSVNDENGDLTRRFTDSADAVLWLTPSSSPGQVQELQDLKLELEKKKPLQPVITRSDVMDEEWDEENDDIIQILKNKSQDIRRVQEEDVIQRVRDLNLSVPVKPAVSISVFAYKTYCDSYNAFSDAGLDRLFESLEGIINEAKTYKVRKAEQQIINFLDTDVLGSLNQHVKPQVDKLINDSQEVINDLRRRKKALSLEIANTIIVNIPDIVERHAQSRNKEAMSQEINQLLEHSINDSLQKVLSEYVSQMQAVSCALSSDSLGEFEDITVDIEQVKGGVAKRVSSSVGAAGGAATGAYVGSLLLPGVGTIVGGAIGGLIGGTAASYAGEYFVETETVKETVGVSSERVINKTISRINAVLPKLVENVFEDVISSIQPTQRFAERIALEIELFETQVVELKR
ncbi:dynamin family protein [Photobacterium damselae]|uniref:dynamin family protein n=1 Tax=Photobacterium damselae TaxID=38293 RepID=UPI00165D6A33|nr:dynamin family protein [Photobacterium damselae]QOQ69560.1 50S ribosome-binding GTPase [Photobacterium damselae subsp. damselae]